MFLASVSFINMLSNLAVASNTATCLMMMHKLCIYPSSLVYVFASVMDPKKKFPPAEIRALVYDNHHFIYC